MNSYSNLKTLRIQSLPSMPQLYFWGKPISQQLYQLHQIAIPPLMLNTKITQIACGDSHCIILTEDSVLGLGDNAQGQLGNQIPFLNGLGIVKIPLKIQQKIISVSCGSYHTLLLDEIGNVYSSGKGDNGELGKGRIRYNSSFEIILSNAKQISAGKDHSLALCGSKVFGWGNSNQGQLGLLITKNYYTPQQLNIYPCTLIYAGPKYSIFVTVKGVYSSGVNNHCQLGLGHDTNVQVPRRMSIEQKIVKLQGSHYCAAGTDSGEWYMWGKGPMGLFKFPTKMSFLKGAESISFGVNFGTILREEKVLVWGSNLWGQLGVLDNFRGYPQQAQQLSNLKLNRICCGGSFMLGFSNNKMQNYDQIKQGSVIQKQQISQQYKHNNFQNKNQEEGSQIEIQQVLIKFQKHQNGQNQTQLPRQQQKRLYTQQQNIQDKFNLRKNQTQSAKVSQIFYEIKPKTQNKSEKLDEIKDKSYDYNLQKQNSNLKERLQFQRYQTLRLRQNYTKNLNKMYKQTLQNKMTHFSHQLNTKKTKINQLVSHLSVPSKQHQQISFRTRAVQQDKIQKMGLKIGELKSLLQNVSI